MYLAGPDTRKLHRIDRVLCRSDPRLAQSFAVFTRLNRAEDMPRSERLRSGRRKLLALALVPLLVLVTLTMSAAAGIAQLGRRAAAFGRQRLGRAAGQGQTCGGRSATPAAGRDRGPG